MSPTKSPHWQTAPHHDAGGRVAQFLVCDRCGYREEDTSRRDRQCQRVNGGIAPGKPLIRCIGTLKGARTAGW